MLVGFRRNCYRYRSSQWKQFHDVRFVQEDKRWPGWRVVIGIETHAQIKSRRKLFSESSLLIDHTTPPNTQVVPFDAAFPGTLPKLNSKCVDLALRTAIALDSDIQKRSSFDRKHYFYFDLPSGYQITQQYAPIALGGKLVIPSIDGSPVVIRIKQIQLEQDTAKSTFNPRLRTSHIDLNRAGTGLMEIVSEPDIRSPEEAGAYVRTLQSILRAVAASDGNMEQGSMRCDVNVSINRIGDPAGTRCEIKNLNSVRFMMAAITHEITRQQGLLATTESSIPQETRGFDEHTLTTFRLRSKEDAPDYRYMPDPNLGILLLSDERIAKLRRTLPELPDVTRERLRTAYDLSSRDLDVLLWMDGEKDVPFDGEQDENANAAIAYFDRVCAGEGVKAKRDPKVVVNWMTHELLGKLAERRESFSDLRITSEQFGELIDLVQEGKMTRMSGKKLLQHMLRTSPTKSPLELARDLELFALNSSSTSALPVSADAELEDLCTAAITALPQETAAVRNGNDKVMNKIMGWVMRNSRGRADPQRTRTLLEEKILRP